MSYEFTHNFRGYGRPYHIHLESAGKVTIIQIRTPNSQLVRLEVLGNMPERDAGVYVEGKYHSTILVESGERDSGAPWAFVGDRLIVPNEDEDMLVDAIEAALAAEVTCL